MTNNTASIVSKVWSFCVEVGLNSFRGIFAALADLM